MSDPSQLDGETPPHNSIGAPGRQMRRYLSPLSRYAIIGSWGILLGIATFYILRKLGY